DVQEFVGNAMSVVTAPVDALNLGLARATLAFVQMLPKFPAARLFGDIVFGWPHAHSHPPNLIPPAPPIPLPSVGPVICAGAVSVLINGLPSARTGDLGFGVWCGGFFPIFEVQTGSSHVFIGGARPARMLIDFTRHCMPGQPGFNKLGAAMMLFSAGMGALGVASSLIDKGHAEQAAEEAPTAEEAMAASAQAAAMGLGAAVGAAQTAADLAAAALGMMMGKDPAIPPGIPIGNFITGSPNVLIGGFPMPGWMMVLKGLGKLLKGVTRGVQRCLPKGGRLRNALCAITGHPVDVASGRVFTSQTDFTLPGRVPIEFTRAYDTSAVDYQGPLGPGWIHPYDIHLWEDETQGMVILRNEEARLVGFKPIVVGERSFNPLEKLWLERIDENVYVVRNNDGTRFKFAPASQPSSAAAETHVGDSETNALRLTEIADRNGNRVALSYDQGRLSYIEDSAGGRLNFVYTILNNGAARLAGINRALNANSSRNSRLVNYSYDANGRLINATDRGLVPWRYAYDQNHLLVRETNRNGLSFHFEYEGVGAEARCAHTWGDGGIYERRLTYDYQARTTVVENSLGHRTMYGFNELDLPVTIINALGGAKHYTYGMNGELLSEIDEIGRMTSYGYDGNGDCVSVTNPDRTTRRYEYTSDSLPQKLIDEAGVEFTQEYDDHGNLVATIDAMGNRREYRYNRFGDLTQAVDPLGGVMKFEWNGRGQIVGLTTPLGATTRYVYDERGRLVNISDPLGATTRYAYDSIDRLTQVERPDGTKHRYEYDPEGNLTSFRDGNGSETRFRYVGYNRLAERMDALGHKRRFVFNTESDLVEVRNERDEAYRISYDAIGRVTAEIGFDNLKSGYDYDPANQLIARVDPAGRVTRFIRDLRGRVVERRRPDASTISFSYDNADRLIQATAPGSELVFMYDALGRVTQESQNGKLIEHEYDAIGRRVKRWAPSGQMVEFTYDADSRLTRVKTPHGSVDYDHDQAGRVTRRRLPGGVEESFSYDRCGRTIEQSLNKPGHPLFRRGYKYDAEGNLIELNDSKNGVSRFAYDPVERLREVLQPEKGPEQFVYDSTGNLLRRGAREFQYGAPDRLTQTGAVTLIYDEVGNLVEKRRAGASIHYSYDPDNRLIAVESEEGGRIEFTYDAFGRRLAKTAKDGETGFLWDGDVMLMEQRSGKFNEYVFESDSYQPLCRFDEKGMQTYHNDHIGTPHAMADDKGNIIWSASYDAYGDISALHIGKSDNQVRFQGQYADQETGLHYNFFRYYDPELGRYINQDPARLDGGLNLYEYALNPLNWIDPLGLSGRGDQSEFARTAEEAVSRHTGVPLNPQGAGEQTIKGSGPGGKRVPDLKVRGQQGSVRLRGSIVEVKASGIEGGKFGDLSSRSRAQIMDAVKYARALRARAGLVTDPRVRELLSKAHVEVFTDLEAPTRGKFADLVEEGLIKFKPIPRDC
ncbi:MAG TPA: RHS repeat-associated core domain-containing protein, partial [Blastocatellia bacterium]|nr:RHS repeat-associated core domain-containing protein [Blastocatellia bacterium]